MIPLRDSQPSHTTPVVTISLIAVNSLVFLYQFSLDAYSLNAPSAKNRWASSRRIDAPGVAQVTMAVCVSS